MPSPLTERSRRDAVLEASLQLTKEEPKIDEDVVSVFAEYLITQLRKVDPNQKQDLHIDILNFVRRWKPRSNFAANFDF